MTTLKEELIELLKKHFGEENIIVDNDVNQGTYVFWIKDVIDVGTTRYSIRSTIAEGNFIRVSFLVPRSQRTRIDVP